MSKFKIDGDSKGQLYIVNEYGKRIATFLEDYDADDIIRWLNGLNSAQAKYNQTRDEIKEEILDNIEEELEYNWSSIRGEIIDTVSDAIRRM